MVLGEGVFTAAVAQMDPKLGDVSFNLDRISELAGRAHDHGARLTVFPECAVTGYRFDSVEEAADAAQTVPGDLTVRMHTLAADLDMHIAVGYVEREADVIYNGSVLVGPGGVVAKYRKNHLPYEAVDRFAQPGNLGLEVHLTPIGRLAMVICYDLRFPETTRVLALKGAEIVLDLTNLPPEGSMQPDFLYRARAAENRIWLLASNRVGTERGVTFVGRSAIVDPDGKVVASASAGDEELIFASIDPREARLKHLVFRPRQHELSLFDDRRPELYGRIIDDE